MNAPKTLLLIGDTAADGDSWPGSLPADSIKPQPVARYTHPMGQVPAWRTADVIRPARLDGMGWYGSTVANAIGCTRGEACVVPGQGIANLSADNSTRYLEMELRVDSHKRCPELAVLHCGVVDAELGVGQEDYLWNLYKLRRKLELTGVKSLFVVLPSNPVVDVTEVRAATEVFCDETGPSVVPVSLDHLASSHYYSGEFMNPLGYVLAGKATAKAILDHYS